MNYLNKLNNKVKKIILLINDSILSILSAYIALFLSDNIFINHFDDNLNIIIFYSINVFIFYSILYIFWGI